MDIDVINATDMHACETRNNLQDSGTTSDGSACGSDEGEKQVAFALANTTNVQAGLRQLQAHMWLQQQRVRLIDRLRLAQMHSQRSAMAKHLMSIAGGSGEHPSTAGLDVATTATAPRARSGSGSSGSGDETASADPPTTTTGSTGSPPCHLPGHNVPLMSSQAASASSPGPSLPSIMHRPPRNISEWQLYVVLQRANLLAYYDIFISQGGDDVQQLLDAGEEEFLEIMALVGMASKPLHVRRLQKELQSVQKFAANPTPFHIEALQKCNPQAAAIVTTLATSLPTPILPGAQSSLLSPFPVPQVSLSEEPSTSRCGYGSQLYHNVDVTGSSSVPPYGLFGSDYAVDNSMSNSASPSGIPTLSDSQIQRIADVSRDLSHSLQEYEPKLVQNKKKISKELLDIINMPESNPHRLDQFRRYAAIYGRFDTKRKADKPLTLHEVSVNEAAAQICLYRPALLTRRDELFPLARQVVKDSGYQYVKGQSRLRQFSPAEIGGAPRKRPASATGLSGTSSPSAPSNTSDAFSPRNAPNDTERMQQRLATISAELQSLHSQRDACAMRVQQVVDADSMLACNRDLERLDGQQVVLTSEKAELEQGLRLLTNDAKRVKLETLKPMDPANPEETDSFPSSSPESKDDVDGQMQNGGEVVRRHQPIRRAKPGHRIDTPRHSPCDSGKRSV